MEAVGLGVGLMLQPGSGLAGRADDYRWWAADNRLLFPGRGLRSRCLVLVASLPRPGRRRRCLFAVALDVLGDAAATWQRSRPWLELGPLRACAAPVVRYQTSFAAQTVVERDAASERPMR